MSVPFHKQTDPTKQAGQIRYGFDREPYLKTSNVAPDIALSDYIARKKEEPPRITFDEWMEESQAGYATIETKEDLYCILQNAWINAIKQGKLE